MRRLSALPGRHGAQDLAEGVKQSCGACRGDDGTDHQRHIAEAAGMPRAYWSLCRAFTDCAKHVP